MYSRAREVQRVCLGKGQDGGLVRGESENGSLSKPGHRKVGGLRRFRVLQVDPELA